MTRWRDRSSRIAAADIERTTLVIPIGATEQHGPHLPVGVDAIVAEHVALRAAQAVSTVERPIVVAPVQAFGSSHHHLPRAGTLSLSSDTMLAVLRDLLHSAADTGVRRMVIVNGHFGNEDVARQAVRDVTLTRPIVAAATGYWSVAWDEVVDTALSFGITKVPGHAGAFETSLMLAIDEQLVDRAAIPTTAVQPSVTLPGDPMRGVLVERHGWVEEIDGFTDAADGASAAAGTAILDRVVAAVAGILEQIAQMPAPEAGARGGVAVLSA
jgi:creatinine amidohydrolase